MAGYLSTNIQQVSIAFASGDLTKDATISAVTTANTFLLPQGQTSPRTSDARPSSMRATLLNSTTVRATKNDTGQATNINLVVLDGSSSLVSSVQYGTIAIANPAVSGTATITSVDLTRSVVIYLGVSSTHDFEPIVTDGAVTLTNATTVTAYVDQVRSAHTSTVSFCVIQFAAAAIQSVQQFNNARTTSSATNAQTITSTTLDNCILAFGGTTQSTYGDLQYIQQTSATNVNEVRIGTGTASRRACYAVVEFKTGVLAGTAPQRGYVGMETPAPGQSQKDTTVTTVSATQGCATEIGRNSYTSSLNDNYQVRLTMTSTTNVRANRNGDDDHVSHGIGYQTFEFSSTLPVTGTAAVTEGLDVVTASGKENFTGTAARTETADATTASGLAGLRGPGAVTETADVATGTGLENFTGTAAVTEGLDTGIASGLETFTGTASVTEGLDAAAGVGSSLETFTGTGAVTETADTTAASGLLEFIGTGAVTEDSDIANSSGQQNFTGTAAVTEDSDSVIASGIEDFTGTAAVTEDSDSSSGSGLQDFTGTAAITEGSDTVDSSGLLEFIGVGAVTEDSDTVTSSGEQDFTGTAAITEDSDAITSSGLLEFIGTAAIVEDGDTVTAEGLAGISGTSEVTEDADTATSSGILEFTGSATVTEGSDTVTGVGLERIELPTLELSMFSSQSAFIVQLIKFSGAPVPAEHVADAMLLDADGYVDLFQIILTNALSTIYIKQNKTTDWQGNTYEGTGVQIEGVANYADETVSRPKFTVFNPNGVYSYLLDQGLLDSATVVRYRVLKKNIDLNKPIYTRQQWKVSRIISVRSSFIVMELRDMLDGQNFLTPGRMYIPPDFPTVSLG